MQLHWEKTLGNVHLVSPTRFSMHLFPFADFAQYLFTVINPNHECDSMPSPVGPPGQSQTQSFLGFLVMCSHVGQRKNMRKKLIWE